ncbi:mitochondrial inner membrane protein Mpv17-like [Amphiura filiformis]|uniref:mitochondrial inner membrane protein Mpv17-like n=1 Tax=Amphiura filiformis TaxID=82378 RepID=UPI003B20B8A0
MASLFRAYNRILNAHPFKTQVVSTGTIMLFSDIFAQQVVDRRGWKGHDFARTCRQALIGFFLVGPTLTVWYRTVDRVFKGAPKIALLKKVAADQLLFAPPFIALFFTVNGVLTGMPPKHIKEILSKNYIPTLITNYKIWPAVQMFNFYLVPLYYRVLVAQVVAVFWNTYLIWKAHDHPHLESDPEVAIVSD